MPSSPVVVSQAAPTAYREQVRADGAAHLWSLDDEASPSPDSVGPLDLTLAGTSGTAGVLGGAGRSTGNASAKGYTTFAEPRPDAVTLEAWVKTTSNSGGRIIGFGDSSSGSSTSYDLALYLGNNGRVNFGVRNGDNSLVTTTSAQAVNDGQWHHVVGVVDDGGSSIVIDGRRSGRNQNAVGGPGFTGYWRVFGDTTTELSNRPANSALAGSVDEVAVYPGALPIDAIRSHYTALTGSDPADPTPTDTYGAKVSADSPDIFWRLGEASGSVAHDTSASASDGTLSGVATYGHPGAVAGTSDTALVFNGTSGSAASKQAWVAPTEYSTEAWFRTATTRGGRIVGFGTSATSLSGSFDRLVCMQNNGQLLFGVNSGGQKTVVTPTTYNDGLWHHVVATQGADGMRLYVDGILRGTNPTTTGQAYTGYWRAGGDKCFSGATSNYLAGTLDEVAVYARVLAPTTVVEHFEAGGGVVANQPPTAAFTAVPSFLTVAFDATDSSDPDGEVEGYAWTFGDGGTGNGATPSHEYAAAGTYPVTLTVTDDDGDTSVHAGSVTVVANVAPSASFTSSATGLTVSTDAAASTDSEGTITSHEWDFGDGTTGTGVTATHAYAAEGTYTVRLTVSDEQDATGTTTRTVTVVRPPNQLPTAAFDSSVTALEIALDASDSTDPDGTVESYEWDFGDGASGTGRTTSHPYAVAGDYDVTLTVNDDRGGSATHTRTVTVAANVAPQARIDTEVNGGDVTFRGSSSSDADGDITTYTWDFGDGSEGTGSTTSHSYAADGTYTIKLTVTDDLGLTASDTAEVTIVLDPSVARDSFDRSQTGGWGTADRGGAWTLTGAPSRYSVTAGSASLTLGAGEGAQPALSSVSTTAVEFRTVLTTSKAPTGGGQYVSLAGRAVAAGSEYRAKVHLTGTGAVSAYLTRAESGTETSLGGSVVPGVTYTPGTRLQVRFQAVGTSPTTLRVKVWAQGQAEPAGWLLTRTDSAGPLQGAGSVGFYHYVSGSTADAPVVFTVDDVWVGPPRP